MTIYFQPHSLAYEWGWSQVNLNRGLILCVDWRKQNFKILSRSKVIPFHVICMQTFMGIFMASLSHENITFSYGIFGMKKTIPTVFLGFLISYGVTFRQISPIFELQGGLGPTNFTVKNF